MDRNYEKDESMKKYFLLIATIISLMIIPVNSAESIKWYDFNTGLDIAIKTGKPVFVDFYADWCYWCKEMDRKTFSDKEVIDYVKKNYIAVRIDTDDQRKKIIYKNQTYNSQSFSEAMGIEGLPTTLFIDKKGNIITSYPGYIEKKTFLDLLNYLKKECYLRNVKFDAYIGNKTLCQ